MKLKCGDCPYFQADHKNSYFGWCQHVARRLYNQVWSLGYTQPSTGRDHICPLKDQPKQDEGK